LRARQLDLDFSSLFSLFALSLSFQRRRRAMMICASPRERSFLSLSFSLFHSLKERERDTIQCYIKKRALPFSREKIRFLTEI
jgi:hypothetical protein